MSPSKKIFFISSLLLAIVLLLWGVYYLSFKKPAEKVAEVQKQNEVPATETQESSPTQAQKTKSDAKIFPVSEEPVLGPIFADSEQVVKYYSKENGKTYQIDPDGNGKKVISEKDLPGLTGVYWSPSKTKVLTKFSKGNGQSQFFYYDYANRRGMPLKNNLDFVVWQNNDKIFYKYFDPASQKRSLNIANPDGTGWEKITELNYKNIVIAPVPQSGLVSFWTNPDANSETVLQSVSIVGQSSKILFTGKFGVDYLWNNNGTKALLSHSDAKGGTKIRLAVINDQGGEYKNLEMPTFVTKCVWTRDNKTVYCALPGSIPESAILPNDYYAGKFNTTDTFWKVNTQTGEKERIVALDKIQGSFDASTLFLNYDESILFFVNKSDGKLYRADL
ncbi:MAG: hypothetical protein AAB487_00150 [Patescibacteria group bacterium]